MNRRARVGVVVVAGALTAAVGPVAGAAASAPRATAQRAAAGRLVRFVRPTADTLIDQGTGSTRLIIAVRPRARLTKVEVDGVDVTGLLARGRDGVYQGRLPSSDLHPGYNTAVARAARDGQRGGDHVRFIAARRDDRLLRVTSFRTRTPAAPLQVGMRESAAGNVRAALSVAQGVSARVYVNHRRAHRAFTRRGRQLSVEVGAAQGLRFGRNLVQILVHRTHPYKHESRYDVESRTVYIGRDAPIASAGADHTTTADDAVPLDGQASRVPRGWAERSFRWRIVSAPKGSRARIRGAGRARPTLVPDRAGTYRVRVSVRGVRLRARRGLRTAQTATTGVASSDTTTITSMPDTSPAGVGLNTSAGSGAVRQIMLGGRVLEHQSTSTEGVMQYAIIDRRTLYVVNSGAFPATPTNMQRIGDELVDSFKGDLNDFVVFNWYSFGPDQNADRDALNTLLQKIGSAPLTGTQRQEVVASGSDGAYHGSAIGVAGAPPGSAFVAFAHNPSPQGNDGSLSGSLRLNGVTGKYDFVFTDPVDFDTAVNQTAPDRTPDQLTIRVGARSYTEAAPGGGVSGFHLLLLDAHSLDLVRQQVFTTNAADGAERTEQVELLGQALVDAIAVPGRPLVILQAFGAPHGNDAAWGRVAQRIGRLGGTREVFDAMNATDPRPLNSESASRKGAYAFVGRLDEIAPLAESSYSLNGESGRLRGELLRAHDGGYEPMIAAPPSKDGKPPVNEELFRIAEQAPQPFPPFKDTNGQPIDGGSAQAVQRFLGGPAVMGVCSAALPTCDIRKSYYQDYRANWPSIQNDLSEFASQRCAEPHPDFTEAQCQGIRIELRNEVSKVAKVTKYFGPEGLQQPYGAAGVSALANVADIAEKIKQGGLPPLTSNTTSNLLLGISNFVKFGNAIPGGGAVTTVLSTAFLMGSYFTRASGSQALIGPPISTAAGNLGVKLAEQYSQAGDDLDNLGRLIVGDYGKLTAVAGKVDAQPAPGETDWRLGNVGQARQALVDAAKQTIYERLVPVAFPKMYDLGELPNARVWYCEQDLPFLPDKPLFADQSDGAQFIARFPTTGWNPLIAVAAANAVGNGGAARIRGVPASITDALFSPIASDGLGLNKLQFYSPRNGFQWFPAQPHPPSGVGDTIQMYPYPGSHQVIGCEQMPDPPGNSSG